MTKKQLMVAGSLTNTEEVIKMAEEMEEGVKNVCSAFIKYVQNERRQSKITMIIELLTNKIGVLSEDTKERIKESNEEKLSKLIKQIFVIDSEQDVLNIVR